MAYLFTFKMFIILIGDWVFFKGYVKELFNFYKWKQV